jgi:2-C-methyl-D-erythritol 4-phosphate cytidylyltransferase
LIESLGHSVLVVPGAPVNFKITTKDDLELADAVLKARAAKLAPVVPPSRGPFDDEAKW